MKEQLRKIDDLLRGSYLIQINSPEKEMHFQEALKSLEKVTTSDSLFAVEKEIHENH